MGLHYPDRRFKDGYCFEGENCPLIVHDGSAVAVENFDHVASSVV